MPSCTELIEFMTTDVLVVADHSDLNVYKTADENGTQLGCCGPSKQGKSSCNGNNDGIEIGKELADIDLNEWAGKYLLSQFLACMASKS